MRRPAHPVPAQVPPLQGLPTVTINEFREYLTHMADLMQKFEAINPTGNSSLPEAVPSDGGAAEDGADNAHSDAAGSAGGGQRRAGLEAAGGQGNGVAGAGFNLDAVPAFYFERDFRLDDLHTFERTGAATEDAVAARNLQESLSEHLDAVEHVLMREIQARSQASHPTDGGGR